ncbi:adenosylcobinamide-GDP ribazoletransferase [Deltaproteobacteria bacterium TL4]
MKGLITAIQTLSSLPIRLKGTAQFEQSLPWFVWVGAFLGSLLYVVSLLFERLGTAWAEGIAVVLLIVSVLLSRGLHLDGLADWADAFWGAYDRERTLAIMKDSFLGTYAVLALILILLAKWTALVALIKADQTHWLIAAFIISRVMQVDLAVWLPYARKTGTAQSFVQGAKGFHWMANMLPACVLLWGMFQLKGLMALFMGWSVCRLMGLWAKKRIGGVTGDVLGACSEIVETCILLFSGFLLN